MPVHPISNKHKHTFLYPKHTSIPPLSRFVCSLWPLINSFWFYPVQDFFSMVNLLKNWSDRSLGDHSDIFVWFQEWIQCRWRPLPRRQVHNQQRHQWLLRLISVHQNCRCSFCLFPSLLFLYCHVWIGKFKLASVETDHRWYSVNSLQSQSWIIFSIVFYGWPVSSFSSTNLKVKPATRKRRTNDSSTNILLKDHISHRRMAPSRFGIILAHPSRPKTWSE